MNNKDKFIGIYENAYSQLYCEKLIAHFDNMQKGGFTESRQDQGDLKTQKDDDCLFIQNEMEFNKIFWEKYKEYSNEFAVLNDFQKHDNYCFKMQKTKIGGGYHVWHCETMNKKTCGRVLAWMVYLNDVEEGGETEFLYQHIRIKPKQGTLIMWPAGFTHTHRGNPPLSNNKYVITGWVEF